MQRTRKLFLEKTWEHKIYSKELDERREIEHTLNCEAIQKDMADYPDGQFVKYIRSRYYCTLSTLDGKNDLDLGWKKNPFKVIEMFEKVNIKHVEFINFKGSDLNSAYPIPL
eukprot:g12290.t1